MNNKKKRCSEEIRSDAVSTESPYCALDEKQKYIENNF